MREIKFRAWKVRLKGKKDEKGDFAGWEVVGGEMKEMCPCKFFQNTPDEVLMQYTGFKDKNGKEGYHADLFISPDRNTGKPIEIVWFDGSWWGKYKNNISVEGVTFHLTQSEMNNSEIIGNVYQNHELLKEVPHDKQ